MEHGEGPTDGEDADVTPDEDRTDRRSALVVVGVAALALIAVLVWALVSDDPDDEGPPGETTSSSTTAPTDTTSSSTSTTGPTTETTFAPSIDDEAAAAVVWPDPSSSRRFDDPVAAARSFAVELVGFHDPVIGPSDTSAEGTAEVEVRAVPDGPATVVQLRRFGDDGSWWVLGALTDDIEVNEPAPGALVRRPLEVQGRSRAFEGTVQVAVHVDGSTDPVGTGFVTGGATEALGAFSGSVDFDPGPASFGAVVFSTESAEDGRVWQATVVRVRFVR